MRRLAATALIALIALPAGTALAACPQTSVADLEDEVMCPVCGTSLATSGEAPLAVQQRRLIDRLVKQCKSKDEIKDALVAQYGDSVLAEPEKEGFGATTFAVPGVALAAGLIAVAFAAFRWRRRRPREMVLGSPSPSADTKRLDQDMERYDL